MIRFAVPLCLLPFSALADAVPHVMTDIAPIHSLTAQVMGTLGTPDLLLPPGADPHEFALRPSDAARLGDADIVFWAGDGLTPWLHEPLETLAGNAAHISLLDVDGWDKLAVREEVGEHADEDDGHDHGHGDFDPHAWLDPQVAAIWVRTIADELGQRDPDNAAVYTANADATVAALSELEANVEEQVYGLTDRPYVLPHDGYQYFENRFGLTAAMSISGIDGRRPGPSKIAEIRNEIAANNIACVFSDVQIPERWADVVIEGTDAKTAAIDGIGVGLDPGPELYGQLLSRLAGQFTECLSDTP